MRAFDLAKTALGIAALGVGAYGVVRVSRRLTAAKTKPVELEQVIPIGYVAGSFRLTQSDVLNAARAGRLAYTWVDLPGAPGVQVFEDAAKLDGVRVPVSAETTAAIVELLNVDPGWTVSPTTPLVEDLIYNAADVRVRPVAQAVADSSLAVPAFNQSLDKQIAAQAAGPRTRQIVSCVGKSWVLSNMATEHPGHPVNYGFHWPLSTAMSYATDASGNRVEAGPWPSVDGKSKVFQQPSTRHNPQHWDYSQTLRLCRLAAGVRIPSHEQLGADRLWY